MIRAFWSAKGGVGVTTCVVAMAALLARRGVPVTVCDLAGDLSLAFGVSETAEGVSDWLTAENAHESEFLNRLAKPISANLSILPWGSATRVNVNIDQGKALCDALTQFDEVLVDVGPCNSSLKSLVAMTADESILVSRLCYLGLKRAATHRVTPTRVIVVSEAGRALRERDVEDTVGSPVAASIPYDPAIARALDAGTLHQKVPRSAERALRGLLPGVKS